MRPSVQAKETYYFCSQHTCSTKRSSRRGCAPNAGTHRRTISRRWPASCSSCARFASEPQSNYIVFFFCQRDMHTHTRTHAYVCVCVCVHVCLYTYIYIYITSWLAHVGTWGKTKMFFYFRRERTQYPLFVTDIGVCEKSVNFEKFAPKKYQKSFNPPL